MPLMSSAPGGGCSPSWLVLIVDVGQRSLWSRTMKQAAFASSIVRGGLALRLHRPATVSVGTCSRPLSA